MRRRKLLGAVLVAGLSFVLGGALVFVLWPPPQAERITREKYDRIKTGMTLSQVEAIIGPPGEYRTGPTKYVIGSGSASWWSNGGGCPFSISLSADVPDFDWAGDYFWGTDTALVVVYLNRPPGDTRSRPPKLANRPLSWVVCGTYYEKHELKKQSLWERFVERVKRLRQKLFP